MKFLQSTWKFFLGIFVTILGALLIFRKDDSAELIDKSTKAGDDALRKVVESNEVRKKEEILAEAKTEKEIEKIRLVVEKRKEEIPEEVRKNIERRLGKKNTIRATELLSEALGVKNLDDA